MGDSSANSSGIAEKEKGEDWSWDSFSVSFKFGGGRGRKEIRNKFPHP